MKDTTPFERLRVYKETLEFVKFTYALCKKFPKDELFALTDQLKRASTSILLNIAESQGRLSSKDKSHFLFTARGSIYEVMAILDISSQQKFITTDELMEAREKLFAILKQLNALINYYQK